MEPVSDWACARAGGGAVACAGAAGATIKKEIAMMQVAIGVRPRKRLLRGTVPPEKLGCCGGVVRVASKLLKSIHKHPSSMETQGFRG
jgi:hypothetical protein